MRYDDATVTTADRVTGDAEPAGPAPRARRRRRHRPRVDDRRRRVRRHRPGRRGRRRRAADRAGDRRGRGVLQRHLVGQLAAVYPASGGTYVYGRERLGPFWGFLAGWGFVVGKTASCAAMALTVGAYAAPTWQRPIAVAAVVALTAVNYSASARPRCSPGSSSPIVLAALALVVAGALFGGTASADRLGDLGVGGVGGILRSAGLLFFAFAGYARIATLGEEVDDPARTIPRAIPRALGITLVVYAVVAVSALAAVGPDALAGSDAPLGDRRRAPATSTRSSRPSASAAPSPRSASCCRYRRRQPHHVRDGRRWRAAPAGSTPSTPPTTCRTAPSSPPARSSWSLVVVTDLRGAIGFSSFCVLAYYAIANASAWTLPPSQRRWPRRSPPPASSAAPSSPSRCPSPASWPAPASSPSARSAAARAAWCSVAQQQLAGVIDVVGQLGLDGVEAVELALAAQEVGEADTSPARRTGRPRSR